MSKTIIVIVAILAVAGLEFYALSLGINGALLGASLSIIGGLAGYKVGLKATPPGNGKSKP